MTSTPATVDEIFRAILTSRVYEIAHETPLDRAPRFSERVGNDVFLKREDQQPVFSFKLRGAFNRISRLTSEERAHGVIAASAGNHAQGVALSARRLGLRALIVMPRTTPEIKVQAVRDLGAEVVLDGDHYTDAERRALEMAAANRMVFVHPFDDPLVIAGQGTVADEIVRQRPENLSAVFVPVGGGGLIAGMGAYIKTLMPQVNVIGVEPTDSDAMSRALAAGEPVDIDDVGLFADGVAVRRVGRHTFPLVRETVDEIVRVDNDQICAAIKDVFDACRAVVEPAGALAVAGLKAYVERTGIRGGGLVAVLSGANMNFDRLRFVAERAELGEAREALFAVTIPERPGAFREFCASLGPRVVTEFNYRLSGRERAQIFVGLAISSRKDAHSVEVVLRDRGYEVVDLSDNEVAKLHVRYMVGGHSIHVRNERLSRFEFPERPGALLQFLETLGGRWNISLFHYRNHGADFGRVLAGFEVPDEEYPAFEGFLRALGYRYEIDRDNDAYRRFLAPIQ
ncbi:MAG TPA: threonine ammonia-lyase, biosynthetic [Vicinamibacterales bacterium]|nr:threonine ammonia-lyase, biosynthetic [Vicinamibacterales bacterium]